MSGTIIWKYGEEARNGVEFWLDWAKGAEWKFSSYYKYSFTFAAAGELLIAAPEQAEQLPFTATAAVGGDADDIYRFTVADPMTWDGISGAGKPLLIVRSEGGILFSTDASLMPRRKEGAAISDAG